MTQIEDVERAVEEVQARLGPEKRLRNFPRIRKFLEGMQQVEQLVKVFLNVSEVVAFVWVSVLDPRAECATRQLANCCLKGPIKFAIMVWMSPGLYTLATERMTSTDWSPGCSIEDRCHRTVDRRLHRRRGHSPWAESI